MTEVRRLPWINAAACTWAVLFGAPHLWWALGIRAGFPGGDASYRFFMASWWRYAFDVLVVLLSVAAFGIALVLGRSGQPIVSRRLLRTAAWIASGMLSLRGVAGMVVDGFSDPVWWPTFLAGGLLFAAVAWRARTESQPAPASAT
jgi:hypothetical protein